MPDNNGVTTPTSPVDDRGVPLQNLQAEMSRKLAEMEARNAERWEAINAKLDAFSVEPEPDPEPQSYDKRRELQDISADPPGYVSRFTKPLEEKIQNLEKELKDTRVLTVKGMWEKQEEAIARAEGKKDWKELPSETQNAIIGIVKEKGWINNPASALDAYEIFRARKVNQDASDPDRISRIHAGTTEGSGRSSGKTPVKTVSRSILEQSVHPKDPGYKDHMKLLDDVQQGRIKIE